MLNNRELAECLDTGAEGWSWEPVDTGGILRIRHEKGNSIKIFDP